MKKLNIVVTVLTLVMVAFCFVVCIMTISDGKSAYNIAVDNGFEGTEAEWLESLKGSNGTSGKSAYEIAVENGFEGTETEWLQTLKGSDGKDAQAPTVEIDEEGYWIINGEKTDINAIGSDGKDGSDGETPTISISSDNYWIINGVKTDIKAIGSDGKDGLDGLNGTNGKSAYDIAVENGFEGTEAEWLESLKSTSASYTGEVFYGKAVNTGLLSTVMIKSTYATSGIMAGSGVIVKDDKKAGIAYILTNYHVVYDKTDGDAEEIACYLYGQYNVIKYKMIAQLVGGSMQYDVAVIKIESDVYKNSIATPVTVRNSDEVDIGENIILIGNALGTGFSTTAGIVSVPSQYATFTQVNNVKYQNRLIRVDAAVNGGNSGGGLFDLDGNLLGIVKAKIYESSEKPVEGMGFVIPSNICYALVQNIIRNCDDTNKQAKIVDIDLTLSINSSSMKKDAEGNVKIYETVYIDSVSATSIFYNKLQRFDVVKSITINGVEHEILQAYQVEELLLNLKIGSSITFKVVRSNEEISYTATFVSATAID